MEFAELVELMESESVKLCINSDREVIMAIFSSRYGPKTLVVQHGEDAVQFRVPMPMSFHLVPEPARLPLMSRLMQLNFENRLSKIGVDDRDGEIVIVYELLLGEQKMDEVTLHRAMGSVLSASDEVAEAVMAISADPLGYRSGADRRREAMAELLKQFEAEGPVGPDEPDLLDPLEGPPAPEASEDVPPPEPGADDKKRRRSKDQDGESEAA